MTQLNQNTCFPLQALQEISRKYPGLWKNIDSTRIRNTKGSKVWPDSCFMPLSFIRSLMNRFFICHTHQNRERKIMNESARVCALAAWRSTQGIYRFDADVYEAVRSMPMDSVFPWEALTHLPEWCIYIETPGLTFMGEKVHGAWIHIDADATSQPGNLCILIDAKYYIPIVLQLTPEPMEKRIKKLIGKFRLVDVYGADPLLESLTGMTSLVNTLIALALFICTQAAEVGGDAERPPSPAPQRRQAGALRPLAPSRVTTWNVGVRMGAALRQARQRTAASEGRGEEGPRNAPRGHIRRAHWHDTVSGPRKSPDGTVLSTAQPQRKMRWQSPLAINVKDVGTLPATIRPVGSGLRAALPERPGAFACRPASTTLPPAADARRA